MNDPSLDNAIRAVVPSLSEIPDRLKQLTAHMYQASKQKINLKQVEEVARYHLCSIVAINILQEKLQLPDPSFKALPIPEKSAKSLISLFQSRLSTNSALNTPVSTPRKRKAGSVSTLSPLKRSVSRPAGSKTKTSFMRKLEQAALKSPEKNLNADLKKARNAEDIPSPVTPKQSLKLMTSREITALCNKFQLNQDIVRNILETFQKYSTKVANEWILICGLIINCYFVINHGELSKQVGAKTAVIKAMFSLQSGGLMLADIHSSLYIVKNLIEYNKWFKKLKIKYCYPIDEVISVAKSGNFITSKYQFNSMQSIKEYDEWEANVLKQISVIHEPYDTY